MSPGEKSGRHYPSTHMHIDTHDMQPFVGAKSDHRRFPTSGAIKHNRMTRCAVKASGPGRERWSPNPYMGV